MRWTFSISNPSPYARTDYVRIDLRKFPEITGFLADKFILKRVLSKDAAEPVPFQIDAPFGLTSTERELIFLASALPKNESTADSYEAQSATYQLTAEKPTERQSVGLVSSPYHEPGLAFLPTTQQPRFAADHPVWDPPDYLELRNRGFRVRIRVSDGAAISACLNYRMFTAGFGEVLQFGFDPSKFSGAFWASLREIRTYPAAGKPLLPIQPTPSFTVVSAHCGPCRAIVTLRSQRLTVEHAGQQHGAYLYRMLSVYGTMDAPDLRTYFGDDFALLREDGASSNIVFSPTLQGKLVPPTASTQLFHAEQVSDYFSVWKRFGVDHRGFGVGADVHIERPVLEDASIQWRLTPCTGCRCINYFTYHTEPGDPFDPTHAIGRFGWYERLYRPISLSTSTPVQKDQP
jgi:hypothetical protein